MKSEFLMFQLALLLLLSQHLHKKPGSIFSIPSLCSRSLFSYITCCSFLTILRLNSMLISFITEEAYTGFNIQNAMLRGVTCFCGWCFLFHVSKEISSSLAVTRMEIPRRMQWVFQQEGLEKGMSFGRSLKIKIGVGVRAGTSPNCHQGPWGGRRSGFRAATTLKAGECWLRAGCSHFPCHCPTSDESWLLKAWVALWEHGGHLARTGEGGTPA